MLPFSSLCLSSLICVLLVLGIDSSQAQGQEDTGNELPDFRSSFGDMFFPQAVNCPSASLCNLLAGPIQNIKALLQELEKASKGSNCMSSQNPSTDTMSPLNEQFKFPTMTFSRLSPMRPSAQDNSHADKPTNKPDIFLPETLQRASIPIFFDEKHWPPQPPQPSFSQGQIEYAEPLGVPFQTSRLLQDDDEDEGSPHIPSSNSVDEKLPTPESYVIRRKKKKKQRPIIYFQG